MPSKKTPPTSAESEPIIIDMAVENALHAAISSAEDARTPVVMELTRRALTQRARGMSEADIAKAEKVEASTLSAWLASPHRGPTVDEAKLMLDTEIKPLATENLMHLLRAGDKAATRQVVKDSGMMKPPKSSASKVAIMVGVGIAPIGSDPLSVAVAIQVKG